MSNDKELYLLEDHDDFDDEVIIRAKWIMDDSRTLDEARNQLYKYAEYLEELASEGYELSEPITDNYGFVKKQ